MPCPALRTKTLSDPAFAVSPTSLDLLIRPLGPIRYGWINCTIAACARGLGVRTVPARSAEAAAAAPLIDFQWWARPGAWSVLLQPRRGLRRQLLIDQAFCKPHQRAVSRP